MYAFSRFRSYDAFRAAREREVKARYTFSERPGQRWVWVSDDIDGFSPATIVEEHAVSTSSARYMAGMFLCCRDAHETRCAALVCQLLF